MSPLVLALVVAELAMAPEPARAPVETGCRICLMTYIHKEGAADGHELIRTECGFTPQTVAAMRPRQIQIATQGTFTVRDREDWGTWYGPDQIESSQPLLQPPCY
jgi:hypothetical protein